MTDDERFDKFVDWFKNKMKHYPLTFEMISMGTYFRYTINLPNNTPPIWLDRHDLRNKLLVKNLLEQAVKELNVTP